MEDKNENEVENNNKEEQKEDKKEENKEEIKEENKEEIKEEKKEEDKEEDKEENKVEKKEENKEEDKEENKVEKKEEQKEEDKEENKEEGNEENKEGKENNDKNDKIEEVKENYQENNKKDNKEDNEEHKEENKDDDKEKNIIENNDINKDENKIENEKENKEQNKIEDKEGNKDEIKEENQDANKEENKDDNEIQNIKENNEEKKEEKNIENEDEKKDEIKEGKDIIKEENKIETKEENKEALDNKEKNDDKNINNKDDINSEDAKDDKSNANSILNLSSSIKRINSEYEMDKITSGLNESQSNILNININDNKVEEKKEEEEQEENKKEENKIEEKNKIEENKIEEENKKEENKKEENKIEENLNINNILGDILRSVVKIKSKEPKENLKFSLYRKNLDNEPKDFGSIIKAKLNEIKQNTLEFFDKTMKEFDKRYNEYMDKINKNINENELKMSKLLENHIDQIENENILDFADNHIFEKFENIFEIHQNIFDSIEEHIGLLKLFLEQSNLIQQNNPLECYINNNSCEIYNSWLLNKIDFQKLNLSNIIKNKYLSDLCSNYLCKKTENNFSSITINNENKENLPLESFFVKENLKNVKKMKFIQLKSGEINSLFKVSNANTNANTNTNISKSQIKISNGYPSVEKLSSLTLINSDLSSNDLHKMNSPSLIKLKLKRNNLSFNLRSFLGNILGKALSLQKLYLQKCSIDDQSLLEILEYLSDSKQIMDSLQFLSFSGNDITKVDLKNNVIKKQCAFKSLQYIDCSKNDIFDFSQENFQAFPQLKVLDLADNNMSNHLFFDNVRKLQGNIVLLSNNLFLNNNKKNAKDYRKYLNDKLIQFNHKIKKLDISFLYNKKIIDQLNDLKLSPMVKISLIKLNLSYCGLDNTTTTKFLQNNYGLLNLKVLNLSNNFITLEIFNLLIKNKIPFDNLYSLDLSMNSIESVKLDDYKAIFLFTQINSKLKKIKLQGTKFTQEFLLLMSNDDLKKEIEKINQKLCNKGFKFVVENEYKVFVSPLEQSFELKDKEQDAF